jgi:hypothetical protein
VKIETKVEYSIGERTGKQAPEAEKPSLFQNFQDLKHQFAFKSKSIRNLK